MHLKIKLHLVSACYCAALISQNWFRSTVTQFVNGSFSREDLYPVEVAAGLSGAIAILLALFCIWKMWSQVKGGRAVRGEKWVQSYLCLLYALPLLQQKHTASTSVSADGSTTIVSQGYGHELSVWVFVFAIVGLLLFQIAIRPSGKKRAQDLRPETTSSLRQAAACL